jgi:hypothetical protein
MPHLSQKRNLQTPLSPVYATSRSVWQLPGGQTLAEFGLRAGILAPKLLAAMQPLPSAGAGQPDTCPRPRRAR